MIRAAVLDAGIDLRPLLQALARNGLRFRVNEESGSQVIWVATEQEAAAVAQLLAQWQNLRQQGEIPESVPGSRPVLINYFPLGDYLRDILRAFFRAPVTVLTLIAALVVAAISNFGSELDGVQRLFYPGFYPGADVGPASVLRILGQIDSIETLWRTFSPALLHFGAVHLVFNSLWLWHFGRMIESQQSSVLYFTILLFLAFTSNMAQYLWSLSANFGGLSGVVYGLLGYIWMWQCVEPRGSLRLPPAMIAFMLVALVAMEVVASAWIASAAHAGGLLAGMLAGLVTAGLQRFRRP
jgi:GlpG protein